jgi:hypothetical protein
VSGEKSKRKSKVKGIQRREEKKTMLGIEIEGEEGKQKQNEKNAQF